MSSKIDRAIQEHRYADIPALEDAMIAEQGDMQQQRDLTVKEKRWTDVARFHEVITQHERPHQLSNQMPQQMKMEPRSSPTSVSALDMHEDIIQTAPFAHGHDTIPFRPVSMKQERYSDISPEVQEDLIAKWGVETQQQDQDMVCGYLANVHWNF